MAKAKVSDSPDSDLPDLEKMRPSDFLRHFGFTHGAWLTMLGPVYFWLSSMDEFKKKCQSNLFGEYSKIYLIGEDPAGFFHPDIQPAPGRIGWWDPSFQMGACRIPRPSHFVKTPEGYGMMTTDESGKEKVYFFADLIKGGAKPLFRKPASWEAGISSTLRKDSKIFIEEK